MMPDTRTVRDSYYRDLHEGECFFCGAPTCNVQYSSPDGRTDYVCHECVDAHQERYRDAAIRKNKMASWQKKITEMKVPVYLALYEGLQRVRDAVKGLDARLEGVQEDLDETASVGPHPARLRGRMLAARRKAQRTSR